MAQETNGTVTGRSLNTSFVWLNATQFLGAFNDNVLKLLLIFFIIRLKGPSMAGAAAAEAGAVFVLPFLLFSPFAGVLADRLSKQRTIVAIKIIEVAVTALGTCLFLQEARSACLWSCS